MSLRIKLAIIGAVSAAAVAAIGIIPALVKNKSATAEPASAKRVVFRINRLKATVPFDEIAISVRTDETPQRFPAGYEFAAYEPNMSGGEFYFPQRRDHHVIDVEVRARNRGGQIVAFQMRQPIEISTARFPLQGISAVRHVTEAGSQSPSYQVEFEYTVDQN